MTASASASAESRLLGAALRGAEHERDELLSTAFGGLLPMKVLTAAFAVAARRRFPADVDRRAVARFAGQFVALVPSGADFAVREVEAAVRAVTGEVALLDAEGLPRLMYAVLLALADELELDDDVDSLLAEAERETAAALTLAAPADGEEVPVHRYRRTYRRLLTDADLRPARAARPHRKAPSAPPAGTPATRAGRELLCHLARTEVVPVGGEVTSADRFLILRATLAEALRWYLPEDAELPEMAALAFATRTVSEAEVDLMKAEYLIRLIMGEKVSLDGFTKRDIFQNGAALLQVIASRWGHDSAAISALVVEAERALAEQGHRPAV